jgi:hypothetical protein
MVKCFEAPGEFKKGLPQRTFLEGLGRLRRTIDRTAAVLTIK